MSSPHGPRPTYVIATAEEAEEVRRVVRERGWRAAARALGWPESNAKQNVSGALRRAPEPPPPPPPSPEEAARAEAVRRAEADPVLGRRCAKCGAPNYTLVKDHDRGFAAMPVGFARLGGRWLCPKCEPRIRPTANARFAPPEPTARLVL